MPSICLLTSKYIFKTREATFGPCHLVASVVSDSSQPCGLQPARLLLSWNSSGKNTGVGCHFLFQGLFLTQGLNPCLLHWQADSLPLSHLGFLVKDVIVKDLREP